MVDLKFLSADSVIIKLINDFSNTLINEFHRRNENIDYKLYIRKNITDFSKVTSIEMNEDKMSLLSSIFIDVEDALKSNPGFVDYSYYAERHVVNFINTLNNIIYLMTSKSIQSPIPEESLAYIANNDTSEINDPSYDYHLNNL